MARLAFKNLNGNVLSKLLDTTIQPKEITKCVDTGIHTASFGFYEGKQFVKDNNLEQTTEFSEVRNNNKFIVCCGNIMVRVSRFDYTHITRRNF